MFQWIASRWRDSPNESEPAIQALDSIDVFGERKDGGVDLIIVDSNMADASSKTRQRLHQKISGYLTAINSARFQSEFSFPAAEKARIIVVCRTEPHPALVQWIEEWKPWVERERARLSLSVGVPA
jgi:uncharacterized protein DUF6572